jgi:putative transposase
VSLSRGCRLFGISRQAVYQSRQRAELRSAELSKVKPLVQKVRMHMPRLGTRKLYHLLKDDFDREGIKVGRDALFDY